MQKISHAKAFGYKFVSLSLIISIFTIATSFAATTPHTYDVELAVADGKKSVETDATLVFGEKSFSVVPQKKSFERRLMKTFGFSRPEWTDFVRTV